MRIISRKSQKRRREEKELRDKGYVECYYCDKLVKPRAIKCPHCGKWYSSGKEVIAFAVALIVVFSIFGFYYLSPGESHGGYVPPTDVPTVLSTTPSGTTVSTSSTISATFNRAMDKASVESAFSMTPSVSGVFSWSGNTVRYSPSGSLAEGTYYTVAIGSGAKDTDGQSLDCGSYTWRFTTAGGTTSTSTRRDIGTGDNEFWSSSTSHPSWAQNAVQTKPVLILTHTEGCYPCMIMTETCNQVSGSYGSQITYYDLTSGTDEPDASQCFAAYDPVPPNYVPLTTILTKGPNNQIIWHSWEGVVEKAELESWINDAISYHGDY